MFREVVFTLFLSTVAFAGGWDCSEVLRSQNRARQMFESRGTETDMLFREVPHFIRIRQGLPSSIELVDPAGLVFRHYTNAQSLKKILHEKKLLAGATPFYYSGYIVDYNVDLTGIFLTEPGVPPSYIGVRPENSSYVDFKLDSRTGVLRLREGILLIPGSPRIEGWKLQIYRERRSEYPEYAAEFLRWDREGIPVPLEIPIEVVDFRE